MQSGCRCDFVSFVRRGAVPSCSRILLIIIGVVINSITILSSSLSSSSSSLSSSFHHYHHKSSATNALAQWLWYALVIPKLGLLGPFLITSPSFPPPSPFSSSYLPLRSSPLPCSSCSLHLTISYSLARVCLALSAGQRSCLR